LESNRIHELEGAESFSSFQFSVGSVAETISEAHKALIQNFDDDSNACARAFRVLKSLITRWSLDLASSQNHNVSFDWARGQLLNIPKVYADMMIGHFYRWISNPRSLLYDPALHRLVHVLMKKVNIIYNNFVRL